MKALIYCDTSTLVNCTQNDFEKIIATNISDFIQVNKNLWLVNVKKYNHNSYLSVTEDIFFDYFEKFLVDDSVFIITELSKNCYYNLPQNCCDFLGI